MSNHGFESFSAFLGKLSLGGDAEMAHSIQIGVAALKNKFSRLEEAMIASGKVSFIENKKKILLDAEKSRIDVWAREVNLQISTKKILDSIYRATTNSIRKA